MTSKIPSSIVNNDTSKVPPPKSKIKTFFSPSPFLSNPYAIAAAVGSLIILKTFNPAMIPASLVAYLYESLKYAGTVITAFLIDFAKKASAVSLILIKTIDEISSAKNFFTSPLNLTSIYGLLSCPAMTLNGHNLISFYTISS